MPQKNAIEIDVDLICRHELPDDPGECLDRQQGNKRYKETGKRQQDGRNIQQIGLPTRRVEDCAPHRIAQAEVHEQRHEERKCQVVQQAHGHVEVLLHPDGTVNVENECGEADRSEMEYERRAAPLLEQHEDPDSEPHDTHER